MKRVLFTVLVSGALLAGSPATALARHHHRHHRHHARIHREHWGASDSADAGSSSENAGKVTSFSDGRLTITLNDGSTVTGQVTDGTQIECTAPSDEMRTEDGSGDNGSGEDQNGGSEDQNGDNGDQGDQEDNAQDCTTSALTTGAVVREAELKITSSGAIWEEVDLQS